jgi:peptidoglycan/xylan/chitin deacetylase (PgdA/CDA1 family)/uncharacterized protein YgiM (DUF1202 family)
MSPVLSCRINRRQLLAGAAASAVLLAGGMRAAPVAAATATAIFRGPTTKPVVAITYDCGSDTGYAASILDTLAREGVPCSFGMTGTWAEANPALVRRMVAEGHQLMNHTYSHPSFTGYSDPSGPIPSADRKEQIQRCERVVADIAGVSMIPYFRPPYGDYDNSVLVDVGAIGFTSCVLWSLDGNGWRGLTQDQIVSRVANNHGNGFIYLFHVGASSLEGPALPRIISTLRGKGYGFATVAGLLGGGGTPPPAAKFVAGDKVRVTAGLYLRTGPGTGYGVISTMPTGTVCTVVSGPTAANGYSWYQLDTPYGRGWAAGEFLEKTGTTPPPPAAKFIAGDRVRVTAGLYLRTGAGFSAGVITTMPTGTICTVVSGPQAANNLSWYQLDTPYGRGWAAGEYLEKVSSGGYPAGTKLKVTAGLYLRTGAGFSAGVITTMPTGTIVTVVSGPQSTNGLTWYQVDTPYGRGWAAGEYMTPA